MDGFGLTAVGWRSWGRGLRGSMDGCQYGVRSPDRCPLVANVARSDAFLSIWLPRGDWSSSLSLRFINF